MQRRRLLQLLGAGGAVAATGAWFWPDEGVWNPCLGEATPDRLLHDAIVKAAWQDIDPSKVWDCHVHLIGNGDSHGGIWVHEAMQDVWSPLHYVRYQFYLNAACANEKRGVDKSFIAQLLRLQAEMPPLNKSMLLAFDYYHDEHGRADLNRSSFAVSNDYAAAVARQYPQQFEWIASIHPYREDCVEALAQAVNNGARAVKWLPPVMGMDPASPKCDRFYAALVKHNLPLLTHAGDEHAVAGVDMQHLGNPLKLRRPLEQGVRVIVAHCASEGANVDLDKGENAVTVDNFRLFARLMDEQQYEKNLFGEISAMTQLNRIGEPLEQVILRDDWQHRLLNGSDYPLPAVMPLFSSKQMHERGYITAAQAQLLAGLRQYNPLLYDFVLKRSLRVQGKALAARVFETKTFFTG